MSLNFTQASSSITSSNFWNKKNSQKPFYNSTKGTSSTSKKAKKYPPQFVLFRYDWSYDLKEVKKMYTVGKLYKREYDGTSYGNFEFVCDSIEDRDYSMSYNNWDSNRISKCKKHVTSVRGGNPDVDNYICIPSGEYTITINASNAGTKHIQRLSGKGYKSGSQWDKINSAAKSTSSTSGYKTTKNGWVAWDNGDPIVGYVSTGSDSSNGKYSDSFNTNSGTHPWGGVRMHPGPDPTYSAGCIVLGLKGNATSKGDGKFTALETANGYKKYELALKQAYDNSGVSTFPFLIVDLALPADIAKVGQGSVPSGVMNLYHNQTVDTKYEDNSCNCNSL